MDGVIFEANGNRAYIRSQEGDFISDKELFIFDSKYAHDCLVVGMPVTFDVGYSATGRARAEKVRIVDWLYPSLNQVEMTVINYSSGIGTAVMACGCHIKLYRDNFLADFKFVDDPNIVKAGTSLVADLRPYPLRGMTRLKAVNIDILGYDEFKEVSK